MLGYNLPEIDPEIRLVLSIPVLTRIYNGSITHWNDSQISVLNWNLNLPGERIIVLARADSSGTTGIFTSGLSQNLDWKESFGIFTTGKSDSKWPNEVITYYAHKNRGMAGLITSFPYSIGYLSIADAADFVSTWALLQTPQGFVVEANTTTVQSTMEEAADYLMRASGHLTTSLVQFSTQYSYPIAGLTYMIVPMSSRHACDARVELVRYIDWFTTSEVAQRICERSNMVPLSAKLSDLIRTRIITKMTCGSDNLWKEAQEQISKETRDDNIVLISAVTLIVSLLVFGSGSIGAFCMVKQIRLHRKLRRKEWLVNIDDILFYQTFTSEELGETRFVMWPSLTSLTDIDHIEDGFEMMEHVLHWPGKWKELTIGLRLMGVKNLKTTCKSLQSTLLWLRDLHHINVLKFYGITSVDIEYFSVSDYCSKGCLSDMLKDKKLNLNNDFKFSLSSDIANGLMYLHSKQLVHGHLKSTNCLLDMKWTVKISDWEFCRLYTEIDKTKCPLLIIHDITDKSEKNEAAMQEFWTSTEILKSDFTQHPTCRSDIYSFGIVLFEIFVRETPYEEHLEILPATEILKAIKNNNLRPRVDDVLNSVRMIMEMAWDEEPEKRPAIDQMSKLLRDAYVIKKSVVDVMLEMTDECTRALETDIKVTRKKLKETQRILSSIVQHNIPSPFVQYVTQKVYHPNMISNVNNFQRTITRPASILCLQCTSEADPQGQLTLYSNLDLVITNLVHRHGGNRLDIALGMFLLIFLEPESDSPLREGWNMSASDYQGSLSVITTSSSKSQLGEVQPVVEPARPHAEAAAEFSLDLISCMKDIFITANGQRIGGFLAAIHTGPLNMCLLDNGVPRCLYYGNTLDYVHSLGTKSVMDMVLVSHEFKNTILENNEDSPYHFEPNNGIDGVSSNMYLNMYLFVYVFIYMDMDKYLSLTCTDY